MRDISRIAGCLIPSATGAMNARQTQLRGQGLDVISLSVGEPDFRTPEHIMDAARQAIADGRTTYTAHAGISLLRKAVCKKYQRDNRLDYSPEQICVTTGAKLAIYAALLTLCDPGDEVIVPSPCWVSYTEQIHMIGAVPVLVEMQAETGFQLDVERIREAVTPRTKAIIVNNPNNPTGAVYSRDTLMKLEALAREKNLAIIADEIYEKLVYEEKYPFISFPSLSSYAYEHTIAINGVSKAYAMTGWRIGYAAGPAEWMKPFGNLIGHLTSSANTIAQYAALEALEGSQQSVEEMRVQFHARRDYLLKRLRALTGITCNPAQGAFYLFPEVRELFGKTIASREIKNSQNLSELLLEKALVGTIPGTAFSAPNHIRLSYANSMEKICEAMDRIETVLSSKA